MYIKSVPQYGKWMLISNLLTLKKKDPARGNPFVAEQSLWWEQLWEISGSFMQGAGMALAMKTEQGLKGDQNDSAFPIC